MKIYLKINIVGDNWCRWFYWIKSSRSLIKLNQKVIGIDNFITGNQENLDVEKLVGKKNGKIPCLY